MSDQFPSSSPASGGNGDGIRTFRGRTIEELIPRIRAELGPDAIILREREGLTGGIGGFFAQRCVEIDAQAATRVSMYDDDLDDEQYEDDDEGWEDEPQPQAVSSPPAPTPPAPVSEAPAAPVSEVPAAPVSEAPATFVSEPPAAFGSEPPAAPVSEPPAGVVSDPPAGVASDPPAVPVSEAPAVVRPAPAPAPAAPGRAAAPFLDEASFAARLEEATFTTDEILASEPPPAPRPAAPVTTPLFIPFDELEEPARTPRSLSIAEPTAVREPDWLAESEPQPESSTGMDPTEQATVEITAATTPLPESDEPPAADVADVADVADEADEADEAEEAPVEAEPADHEYMGEEPVAQEYVDEEWADEEPVAEEPMDEEPAPGREPLAPAPWLAFAEEDAAAAQLNIPQHEPPRAARSGAPVPQFNLPVTGETRAAALPQAPTPPAPVAVVPPRYLARGVRRRSGILPAAERMLRAALDAAVAANERRELDYQALLAARQAAQPFYQPAPSGYQPAPPGYHVGPGYQQQPRPPGYQPDSPGYQPAPGYEPAPPGYQPPPGYEPAPAGYLPAPPGYQLGPAASEPVSLLSAPAAPAHDAADPGATEAPGIGDADEQARIRYQEHARDAELERRLVASGLSASRAAALVSATISLRGPFSTGGELADDVRSTIATALPTARGLPAGHGAVAIVGAGGSGKTRCVAALATAYARAGSLVSVASLGSPGREDELGELLRGEAVNIIPAMRTRATARAVTSARERGLVIIDTAPVTPGDGSTIDVIAEALRSFGLDGTYLAVPATLSSLAAAKLIDGFCAFDLTGLVATHVDETDLLGMIVELSMLTGIPLSYTQTGLDLQDAIAPADPEQIAAALLR